MIVDGADQSAYGLQHFPRKTKSERGRAIKVRLIGVLKHAGPKRLKIVTMTEEQQTDTNRIFESMNRKLNDLHMDGHFPGAYLFNSIISRGIK